MGANPSIRFIGDDLPVTNISWFDAIEYCNRRSQREGLESVYTINESDKFENEINRDNYRTVTWNRNANGYRLPTELFYYFKINELLVRSTKRVFIE